jgi:hypothetical protein
MATIPYTVPSYTRYAPSPQTLKSTAYSEICRSGHG